jgi:hypothetical protein
MKGAPVKPKKESKVLRDEQTFTTTKKKWPILWLAGESEQVGTRTVETKKAVWIELYRSVEFFPSRFVAEVLKDPLLMKGRDPKDVTVEKVAAFMEAYVENTRHVAVMYYDKRPRPKMQVDLEDELNEVYGTVRQQASVIQQQAEQLEALRERLKAKP